MTGLCSVCDSIEKTGSDGADVRMDGGSNRAFDGKGSDPCLYAKKGPLWLIGSITSGFSCIDEVLTVV